MAANDGVVRPPGPSCPACHGMDTTRGGLGDMTCRTCENIWSGTPLERADAVAAEDAYRRRLARASARPMAHEPIRTGRRRAATYARRARVSWR